MKNMKQLFTNNNGFSLIELTVVIVIIGLMLGVAMQSMTTIVNDMRRVKTEREMEMLADAIVGSPDITNGGVRADFGYVGDVGAFPPDLQALYENPGGYVTWHGPYIPAGFTQDSTGFKTDEWGKPYTYTGGVTITSTGSGNTITKRIADATVDYILNSFNGVITDAGGTAPGSVYRDSVTIVITVPDGYGNTVTRTYHPDASGGFTVDSLPVGIHPLRIIYVPNVDTLLRQVTILPRNKGMKTYQFSENYF